MLSESGSGQALQLRSLVNGGEEGTLSDMVRQDFVPSVVSARKTTKAMLLHEVWPRRGKANIEHPCNKGEVSKILREDQSSQIRMNRPSSRLTAGHDRPSGALSCDKVFSPKTRLNDRSSAYAIATGY